MSFPKQTRCKKPFSHKFANDIQYIFVKMVILQALSNKSGQTKSQNHDAMKHCELVPNPDILIPEWNTVKWFAI